MSHIKYHKLTRFARIFYKTLQKIRKVFSEIYASQHMSKGTHFDIDGRGGSFTPAGCVHLFILSARKIYSRGCTSKKIGAIIKEKGRGG